MKKTIFIIPGYRQYPENKSYVLLSKKLEIMGYCPIPVKVEWKKTTISQNTKRFIKKYLAVKGQNKYIIGFSFGAMIALLASTRIKTSGLLLCSLSPYFKEDLPRPGKKHLSAISEILYNDFSLLEFNKLTHKIKAGQIVFLYGSKESPTLIRRSKAAYKNITVSKKNLTALKNVGHDIGHKTYLEQITKHVQNFT